MKILLTGYNGFVGEHFQKAQACEILADEYGQIPINNLNRTKKCIRKLKPDAVIHLAAQSNVPLSFHNPKETYAINFYGTLNLLEALRETGFRGRFLFVGSGDVYGHTEQFPIVESTPLRPRNPYAVSKAAAEALCYQWSQTTSIQIIMARSFNHIGTGQSENFVISSFAKQIIEIKLGIKEPVVKVGNIDVTRDFTDVKDVVQAYLLLLKYGDNGEVYNVCSGNEHSIRVVLLKLAELAGIEISICEDKNILRPAEQKRILGSYEKLNKATGWQPQITLDKSLQDILYDIERTLTWQKTH